MAYVAVRRVAFLCLFLLGLSGRAAAQSTPLPNGFELVPVVSGLNLGVAFAFAPDGRLFIAEKSGVVRVFDKGALLSVPFIDISTQVNNVNDRGLLGIAVHPSFPAQPYVYLLYTYDPPETQGRSGLSGSDQGGARVARLLRVSADPAFGSNRALAGSELVMLGTASTWANIGHPEARNNYAPPSCGPRGSYVRDCIPADEDSHTIGTVSFGPDGALYVSSGDGCNYLQAEDSCTRAADVDSLAGKILRLDPLTGAGLADNPFFAGDAQDNRAKVYQMGLRNPFRFSFDRENGQLYVGDVGWNTWEEINRAGKGANFGWPCYEGGNGNSLVQAQYASFARCRELANDANAVTASLYAYSHDGGGSSIQLGDVYRGTRYPPVYRGSIFYSDYNRQQIRYLTFDTQGRVVGSQVLAEAVPGITQMTSEPGTSDLFMMRINWSGGAPSSSIERLRYTAPSTEGPLSAGVYRLRSEQSLSCVQAFPEERYLFFFTRPARIETRDCSDATAQRFSVEEVGASVYRLVSRSLNQNLTTISNTEAGPRAPSTATTQRFRLSRLGVGFQLKSESNGLCLATTNATQEQPLTLVTCGSSAAQSFRFLPDGNSPPQLNPIADQNASLGADVQLLVEANDVDGDSLTYFAEQLPPSLSIDPETGLITGRLTSAGVYEVTVRVSDGNHEVTGRFVFRVVDNRVPRARIVTPLAPATYRLGDTISYSGEATDFDGNPLPAANVSWTLLVHHNQHVHISTLDGVNAAGGVVFPEDHGDGTWLELCLNAIDALARRAQACRELRPIEVDYTITSSPVGLSLPWEGVLRTTPFTVRTQVGAVRQLSAPLAQNGYQFESWSNSAAAAFVLVIGEQPTTLTAIYRRTAPPAGTYDVVAQHSGKCITYYPATRFLFVVISPEEVEQETCSDKSTQRLVLSEAGSGFYRLMVSGTARVLGVAGSTAAGARVVPEASGSSQGQLWRLLPLGSRFALQNAGSGLCMEVQGSSTLDATALIQSSCASTPAQSFSFN